MALPWEGGTCHPFGCPKRFEHSPHACYHSFTHPLFIHSTFQSKSPAWQVRIPHTYFLASLAAVVWPGDEGSATGPTGCARPQARPLPTPRGAGIAKSPKEGRSPRWKAAEVQGREQLVEAVTGRRGASGLNPAGEVRPQEEKAWRPDTPEESAMEETGRIEAMVHFRVFVVALATLSKREKPKCLGLGGWLHIVWHILCVTYNDQAQHIKEFLCPRKMLKMEW